MDVDEARDVLRHYSNSAGDLDDGILEYLLIEIMSRTDPGEDEDIQDLLFSLLPDLSMKDFEVDVAFLISKLAMAAKTKKAEGALPTFEDRIIEEGDNEDIKVVVDLMKKYEYPEENPIDSSTLSYIIEVWKAPDVEPNDLYDMIKSYFHNIDAMDDSSAFLEEFINLLETIGSKEKTSSSEGARSKSKELDNFERAIFEIASDKRVLKTHTEEEKRERKLLDQKYGHGVITPKYDEKGKAPSAKPLVMFVENEKAKSKARYRDGVVVAHKGEKFIVEKEEEYDGGSRGRVKSKGKRGPGVGGGWGKK